jgi:chromosome segregation ATPase
MASLRTDPREDVLWTLIESRDRAFAAAHELFREQITEKEAEIAEKEAEIAQKEAEIARKEAEIMRVTAAGAARQAVIDELKASKEYRLGLILFHPWAVLRSIL